MPVDISDIEAALVRVQENPNLLRPEEPFHPELSFYRVNKHLLVCDVKLKAIFLLDSRQRRYPQPPRGTRADPGCRGRVASLAVGAKNAHAFRLAEYFHVEPSLFLARPSNA